MHSRTIRDQILDLQHKNPKDKFPIKLLFLKLASNPKHIYSLKKIVKRLFPEYEDMLERILLLK